MTEQETTQIADNKTAKPCCCLCSGGKISIPALIAVAVGLGSALVFSAVGQQGLTRFMFAYITSFAFFLSLSLGALFFVSIQHVTRAGWSVTSRRVAEVLAMTMPMMAIAFLPIAGNVLWGSGDVYPWAASHEQYATAAAPAQSETRDQVQTDSAGGHDTQQVHEQEDTQDYSVIDLSQVGLLPGAIDEHTEQIYTAKKAAYLNGPFFIARWIVYFAIWIGLSLTFWRKSVQQDKSGDPALTRQMELLAPLAIVLFAPTVTFASFDLLMSLSPAWYSTIFGVYYFSGAMVGIFALLIVVLAKLKSKGLIDDNAVTTEHFHDHGKFLFGFVIFWAYIAFSQYLLIWYASLPETTFWFAARGATTVPADFNSWSFVSIALVIGNFFIPFLGLLSRHIKRNNTLLVFWAIYLLIFHWVDLWWIVMPEFSTQMTFGIVELGCLLGLGGLFAAGGIWVGSLHTLVPERDPRLSESLAFENF